MAKVSAQFVEGLGSRWAVKVSLRGFPRKTRAVYQTGSGEDVPPGRRISDRRLYGKSDFS